MTGNRLKLNNDKTEALPYVHSLFVVFSFVSSVPSHIFVFCTIIERLSSVCIVFCERLFYLFINLFIVIIIIMITMMITMMMMMMMIAVWQNGERWIM